MLAADGELIASSAANTSLALSGRSVGAFSRHFITSAAIGGAMPGFLSISGVGCSDNCAAARLRGCLVGEWRQSGEHLVRHAPKRIQVRAPVHRRVRGHLFRRHVRGRAERHPELREGGR